MQEIQVQSLGWEDPLEKEMATHSSILAWEIPWTKEPSRLQSMRSQRLGHDCTNKQQQRTTHLGQGSPKSVALFWAPGALLSYTLEGPGVILTLSNHAASLQPVIDGI